MAYSAPHWKGWGSEGKNFLNVIREKLKSADLVIMVVTPRYYESSFCLCEMGATWAIGKDIFPSSFHPLNFDSLKAVLVDVQCGIINDERSLSELRDWLVDSSIGSGTTGRWEAKRDEFLRSFTRLQIKGPSVIPFTEHEKLRGAYLAAQEEIQTKLDKSPRSKELSPNLSC